MKKLNLLVYIFVIVLCLGHIDTNEYVPVVNMDISSDTMLVPMGKTVGIRIKTQGVMVLSVTYVNDENSNILKPCEGVIKAGDYLLSANGTKLDDKEILMDMIEKNHELALVIERDGEIINKNVATVKDIDGANRLGIWIRDSTQGIGTVTYYNPATDKFGALGHGILDADTKGLMSIQSGDILNVGIDNIKKGKKGSPGELMGAIQNSVILGTVKNNTNYGIYGNLNEELLVLPDAFQ